MSTTTQSAAEAGQVTQSAAEVYDTVFVPALFGQFAPWLVEAAHITSSDRVLDVACGTGIAAIAAKSYAPDVTGIDINPGMLDVARRKDASIDWHQGAAEALPFDHDRFDVTLCLFALMFLADRSKALQEMARVTRPGGRIGLVTWESLDRTPGYNELVPMLAKVAGAEAAEALTAPFVLGDPDEIRETITGAGLRITEMCILTGTARHPSIDAWIDVEIGGWTLADLVNTEQVAELKAQAHQKLTHLCRPDGAVRFPAPAHLIMCASAKT